MFFFNDPLEQFIILSYKTGILRTFCILTDFTVVILVNCILIMLFIKFSQKNKSFSVLMNVMFLFVKSVFYNNVKKQNLFIIYFFLFFFLLVSNLVGLLPHTYTITSSLVVVFFLSGTFFVGINFIGIYIHRQNMYKLFLHEGIPLFIVPGLFVIEVISYFARFLSLAIRLFSNMLSGHILLKILGGIFFSCYLKVINISIFFLPIFWVFFSFIFMLELGAAMFQAGIFIILLSLYLDDVMKLEEH